jgi:hypothetical protein
MENWELIIKFSGIICTALIPIFIFFVKQSAKRAENDRTEIKEDFHKLFEDIEKVYERINNDYEKVNNKINDLAKDLSTRMNLIDANFYQMRGEHNSNHRRDG